MRIVGRRVVITGASSGIGRALALEIGAKGARLLLCSRRLDRLNAVAGTIVARSPDKPRPLVVQCDVRSRESVRRMVQQAHEWLGGIDVLVNNAGVCIYGDAELAEPEDYRSVMGVNFYGPLNCMMEIIPHMKHQKNGLVVNVSSLAAIHGVPYMAAYSASKAALAALGESVRAELAGSGIRVMNVYPGYTDTEIFTVEKKLGGARRPEGPYQSPSKVARAVVRSIEAGKNQLILSPRGKAMAFLRGIVPNLVVRAMARMALVLREEEKVAHA